MVNPIPKASPNWPRRLLLYLAVPFVALFLAAGPDPFFLLLVPLLLIPVAIGFCLFHLCVVGQTVSDILNARRNDIPYPKARLIPAFATAMAWSMYGLIVWLARPSFYLPLAPYVPWGVTYAACLCCATVFVTSIMTFEPRYFYAPNIRVAGTVLGLSVFVFVVTVAISALMSQGRM